VASGPTADRFCTCLVGLLIILLALLWYSIIIHTPFTHHIAHCITERGRSFRHNAKGRKLARPYKAARPRLLKVSSSQTFCPLLDLSTLPPFQQPPSLGYETNRKAPTLRRGRLIQAGASRQASSATSPRRAAADPSSGGRREGQHARQAACPKREEV
jgi:hypothetical protein